jgi:gas vesicle protein
MMAKDNGGGFMAGFVLGGLIGAALAILFAPQPGEQTVSMIREKGNELKQRFGDMSPEEVKETVKKSVREAIEEGRLAATRTKEEMLSRLDELKEAAEAEESSGEIELS